MATQHVLPVTRADDLAGRYQSVIAEGDLAEESGVLAWARPEGAALDEVKRETEGAEA